LVEEYNSVVKLFETKEWQLYKFDNKGPYKRYLTKLTKLSKESDPVILDRFGVHKNSATFTSLIELCLTIAEDSKQAQNSLQDFKTQLERMQRSI